MSRILLVDDSPHAQRMGERILTEEGYEVVTVSNADSALIRLEDADPDVVLADTVMPGRTGYEICQYLKMNPRHRHVRVILTAGVLEPFDDARVRQVEADATLNKPFEASALVAAVKPLAEAASAARANPDASGAVPAAEMAARTAVPFIAVVDSEQVRAAVTLALDASMAAMVDEISRRVMDGLRAVKAEPERPAHTSPASVEPPHPAAPPAAAPVPAPHAEHVRRVTALRPRSGSILGLSLAPLDQPETPPE
jgi:CheY-like chemotaxis protein